LISTDQSDQRLYLLYILQTHISYFIINKSLKRKHENTLRRVYHGTPSQHILYEREWARRIWAFLKFVFKCPLIEISSEKGTNYEGFTIYFLNAKLIEKDLNLEHEIMDSSAELFDLVESSDEEKEIVFPKVSKPGIHANREKRIRRIIMSDDENSDKEADGPSLANQSDDHANIFDKEVKSNEFDVFDDSTQEVSEEASDASLSEELQESSDEVSGESIQESPTKVSDKSIDEFGQDSPLESFDQSNAGSPTRARNPSCSTFSYRTVFTPSPEKSETQKGSRTSAGILNLSDDSSSFKLIGKLPSPKESIQDEADAKSYENNNKNRRPNISDIQIDVKELSINIQGLCIESDDESIELDESSILSTASVKSAYAETLSDEKAITPSPRIDHVVETAWTYDDAYQSYSLSSNGKIWPESENHLWTDAWPEFSIPKTLYDKLFNHQRIGVQWMAVRHASKVGGIMGDDMGMGKTYQTLALLGGLMRERTIRNALILCPVSLMRTWEREANDVIRKMCGVRQLDICVVSSDISKNRRTNLIREAISCSPKKPYLLICTFGQVSSCPKDLVPDDYQGNETYWDYIIADEGHKLKNPSTKVHKGCQLIASHPKTRRLILTGTCIQNNLKELWALFDWACSGRVLSSQSE